MSTLAVAFQSSPGSGPDRAERPVHERHGDTRRAIRPERVSTTSDAEARPIVLRGAGGGAIRRTRTGCEVAANDPASARRIDAELHNGNHSLEHETAFAQQEKRRKISPPSPTYGTVEKASGDDDRAQDVNPGDDHAEAVRRLSDVVIF